MPTLLQRLLAEPVDPIAADSLEQWWPEHRRRHASWKVPVDRGICGGLVADRVGYAFLAGYDAALHAMVPALRCEGIATFCATEEGGAHPSAIRTTLAACGDGTWKLDGRKRWSTGGTLAERFLVVASTGTDEESGRNRLRVANVRADVPGVRVVSMPPTEFAPEIPHAEVELDGVVVAAGDLLEGDGYDAYLKPFRTVEDLHVHAAVLAYLLGVARRHRWAQSWCERAAACLVGLRALTFESPRAAETHVAVAGELANGASLLAETAEAWAAVDGDERARWDRDRKLLSVAGRARDARRASAWTSLSDA